MYLNSWEYVAGLFDGEGSIVIRKSLPQRVNRTKSAKYSLAVSLTLTRGSELIYGMVSTFGGHAYIPKLKNSKWKPRTDWNADGIVAYRFLKFIYPYLFIKKEEARVAIEFYENNPLVYADCKGTPQDILDYRESIYIKLQELKRV